MVIDCRKFGFKDHDWEELAKWQKPEPRLNYPKPVHRFRLVYQSFNQSIEEVYFWLLSSLRDDWGLYDVTKVTDVFTAAEQSAFWGQAQQRMTIQQGQVSNYLATIGKLTKELFQIVREMRILDERMELYEKSYEIIRNKGSVFDRRMSQSAEVVLRGYWVDLKDGGVKSPGSVYGLATTLGYASLPDIFFAAPPMKNEEVDDYVNTLKFNNKLKDVLRRKLRAYTIWKDFTYKEIKNRRLFTLKFLRQHYNSIQLYISWVKPYLRNVKRLQQNFDKTLSEDLIGAFEGSFTEIEIVCKRPAGNNYFAVVVVSLFFRSQPHMDFHQEGYQHKGPVHIGRSEFYMRGYAWTKEEYDNYIRMREEEMMDLLGDIDKDLKASIDALGDELRKYLKEAGEKFPEDIKKDAEDKKAAKKRLEQMKGAAEPFTALFSGFKELFGAFMPSLKKKDKGKPSEWQMKKEKKKAIKDMRYPLWNTYKNFKKAHRMITW
jgi:hypothetical protein